jgi:UDP-glucose 4-epimerase
VADVVAATRSAATAPGVSGEVFNVGGGSRIALADAIEHIGELNGRPLEVQHLPMQDGDVRDTGADTTRAREALGYAPSAGFEDGLRAEFDWVVASARRGELNH